MIRLYTEIGKEHIRVLDELVDAWHQKSVWTVHDELNRIAEARGRSPVIDGFDPMDSHRVYCARLVYSEEQMNGRSHTRAIPKKAFLPIDVEMSNRDPQDWTRTTPMIDADLLDTLADHKFIDVDVLNSGVMHYPVDEEVLSATGEVKVLQERDTPIMLLSIVTIRARGRKLHEGYSRYILGLFPLKINRGIAFAGIALAILGGARALADIGFSIGDCLYRFGLLGV